MEIPFSYPARRTLSREISRDGSWKGIERGEDASSHARNSIILTRNSARNENGLAFLPNGNWTEGETESFRSRRKKGNRISTFPSFDAWSMDPHIVKDNCENWIVQSLLTLSRIFTALDCEVYIHKLLYKNSKSVLSAVKFGMVIQK